MKGRAVRGVLRATLLAGAVAALVIGARGWYILAFVGVFAAARLGGPRVAVVVALVSAGSRFLLPTAIEPGIPPDPARIADALLDLVAGMGGLGLSLALQGASSQARLSAGVAEARAGELGRAARREAEVRRLAREVASPQSVRQLADRFARQSRGMLGAEGVSVLRAPAADEAAGSSADGVLAVDGRSPDPSAVHELVTEASRSGNPVQGPSSLIVPLLGGERTVAVAAIALVPGQRVEADDVEGLVLLGRIAGEAMARSELGAISRRDAARAAAAAERIRRLQNLAAALGRELDGEAIARLVVDAALDGTDSGTGVLSRVDPDRGDLELLHARGYPVGLLEGERRLPLAAALPAPSVARTGEPVRVDAASWGRAFPGASDLPTMAGLGQVVALPVGGSRPLAVLVVGRAGPVAFDEDDIGFLDAVAEHAAQALRRAVLVDLLRDRDRRLGLTLGVARAGTWEMDVESRRIEVSGELRRLYGIPDDQGVASLDAYLDRVDPEDRDRVREAISQAATGSAPFMVEFRVPRPDGTSLRMLGVGRTFADQLGRPMRLMAIDRDVTPERAAEAERERLLEQEREARRLSEAFFGVMSHELRTPVTTIIAGARLVGRSAPLDPGDREIVDDIAFEANRLHRLIDDLLVLSRIERGNLLLSAEPVHLGHLVDRVVAHEQRRWPETTFVIVPESSHEVIDGEDTYVEQVLRNLLSNAAKYSPVGSMVRVEVRREADEVVLRVLDEGTGVGAEELGDLFSLFYRSPTTAAAASGAGIGLFVCDRLIRAMGGRIWARRRPEGGSEFGFALKAIAEDEGDEAHDGQLTHASDDGPTDAGTEPIAVAG